MKHFYLTCIFSLSLFICQAKTSADDWHWANTFDCFPHGSTTDIAVDQDGSSYQAGTFLGTIHFDDLSLTAQGIGNDDYDGFLVKTDSSGNPLWAVSAGSENTDRITAVDVDNQGNIILTGYSSSASNPPYNDGPITFQSTDDNHEIVDPIGSRMAFIAKYNTAGELIWVETTGSDAYEDCKVITNDLVTDESGNIYVTGHFWNEMVIGEDFQFTAEYYGDGFVAKFDSLGNALWAFQMNMSYHGRNYHIALDPEDNVIVAGVFEEESIAFPDTVYWATQTTDPDKWSRNRRDSDNEMALSTRKYSNSIASFESKNNVAGNREEPKDDYTYLPIIEDAFIAKYNTAGEYLWSRHISGNQDEMPGGLKTDNQGNIFVAFNFMDNITIGDSTFVTEMGGVDITYYDIAIARLSSEGAFDWARVEGTNSSLIFVRDISLDSHGRLMIGGRFNNSPVFDDDTAISGNPNSAFLAKYDNDGSFIRALPISGEDDSSQSIRSLFYGDEDRLYIGGGFSNNISIGDEPHYGSGVAFDVFLTSVSLELPPPPIEHPGPENLSAEVFDEYNVALEWDCSPNFYNVPEELAYDEGSPAHMMDMEQAPVDLAIQYQHSEDAVLNEIKVYVLPNTNFERDLTFYVYGNDNGLPDPSNVIGGPYTGTIPSGNLGNELWVSIEVDDLFIQEGEKYHIVNEWSSSSQYKIGLDDNSPLMYSSLYMQGTWTSFANSEAPGGLMIRAGTKLPAEALYYNVYRNDEKVNEEPLFEKEYEDLTLPNGTHTYYVTSIFDAGETSGSEMEDVEVIFQDQTEFVVNITTNSGVAPEGAKVTLANQNGNPEMVYEKEACSDGMVQLDQVWTGWGEEKYDLLVRFYGHERYMMEGIEVNQDTGPYNVALKERINAPYALEIDAENQDPGKALFTWNNATDFFEGFEGAEFPPGGWTKISPDEGIGWQLIEVGETPMGWQGGVVEAAPDGGQQMAYVTYETGGALSNDQWLVTPKVRASEEAVLSFYLRCEPNMYDDRVEIRISTTGQTEPEAFDILVDVLDFSSGSSSEWIYYEYPLTDYVAPETELYIAFREHMEYLVATPIITLDNVFVGKPDAKTDKQAFDNKHSTFEGFAIFLNDLSEPLATDVMSLEYQFEHLEEGTHTAGVQAVYSSGASEIITREFYVEDGFDTHVDNVNNIYVKVYPNPAKDNLDIYADDMIESVTIIDLHGAIVYQSSVDDNRHAVNTAALQSGTYLVKIQTQNGIAFRKVQVIR